MCMNGRVQVQSVFWPKRKNVFGWWQLSRTRAFWESRMFLGLLLAFDSPSAHQVLRRQLFYGFEHRGAGVVWAEFLR